MKRVTVILGAGASVDFLRPDEDGKLLTTSSLTNLLRPQNTDGFLDKTDNCLKKINNNWALTTDNTAYKYYKKIYLRCVEHSFHHGFNFEGIIYLIDSVVDMLGDNNRRYEASQGWGNESISYHLFKFFNGRIEANYNTIIEKLPFDVRHYLLQHIAEHHTPCKDAHTTWLSFFQKINNNGYAISVFNLNYDRLIMEVAEKSDQNEHCFYTGFKFDQPHSEFDPSEFYNTKNVLAQLHGSIHFVPTWETSEGMNVSYYQDLNIAASQRLKFMTTVNTQDNRGDYNWAMVTGLSKFEYIAKEPYATYYRRLIRDLDESEIIVIIGYGGGDRHINMLLKSPLTTGKKLIVVDYADEEWTGKKVSAHFGQKLSEFLHNDFFNNSPALQEIVELSNNEKCTFITTGAKKFLLNDELLNKILK